MTKKLTIALMATTSLFADTQASELLNRCATPVLSVAINDVDCTARTCQKSTDTSGFAALLAMKNGQDSSLGGIGIGLKSMLTNAIRETKCFKVVDLAQFEKTKKMMELTGQVVKPPKIDLIVGATISQLDTTKDSGSFSLAGISSSSAGASINFDLQTMNPATLEMIETKSFTANSKTRDWGVSLLGLASVGGGTSKNQALDSVTSDVVTSSVNYLTEAYASKNITQKALIKVKE